MVGPVVVTAVVLTIIGLSQGWTTSGRYLIAAAATFMLFGRFVILFGSDASVTETVEGSDMVNMLTSEQLFCMVTYMDVMTALFVAFNVGLLFRLPIVGPRISGLVADAKFILRMQPWMSRATFAGLVAFVIFPTSTTGSIGGSILGRLLGLTRRTTLFAIFLGSVLGNGLMYFFSEQLRPFKEMLQDSTPAKVIGIVGVIFLIVGIERWFSRLKKKYMAQEAEQSRSDVANPVG